VNRYPPSPSVFTVRVKEVSALVAVTSMLGYTAPLESFTIPRSDAVVLCASSTGAKAQPNSREEVAINQRINPKHILPPKNDRVNEDGKPVL